MTASDANDRASFLAVWPKMLIAIPSAIRAMALKTTALYDAGAVAQNSFSTHPAYAEKPCPPFHVPPRRGLAPAVRLAVLAGTPLEGSTATGPVRGNGRAFGCTVAPQHNRLRRDLPASPVPWCEGAEVLRRRTGVRGRVLDPRQRVQCARAC